MICDINNKEVTVGSYVKIIDLDPRYISSLPVDLGKLAKGMLGKVVKVTELAYGTAVVETQMLPNKHEGISLGLSSEEMEIMEYK